MEATVSSCGSATSGIADVATRFGSESWMKTGRNTASTRIFMQTRRCPPACLEIAGPRRLEAIEAREMRGRRRRETRLRYAPRPNSVAEAQSRFDQSNANSSSILEREMDEDEADVESRHEHQSDSGVDDLETDYKMARVCDRLIDVFLVDRTVAAEWRKLIAFSSEWSNIRPHFFKRCLTNAKTEEDPKRRGDLLKLSRQLKEVDEDMMRHDRLFGEIEENEETLDSMVAKRRKDFTSDFFDHLHLLANASYRDLYRREVIAALASRCWSAVEAHDAAESEGEKLGEAQLKFDDVLNSPSLEDAVNKIDKLAQRKELDSTLMLLFTKAWASAKESTMMKDEVKDVMFHLYNVARGNMQRLVPKEVRIMRYLLSIQDPLELRPALVDAFSPGSEIEGNNEDLLYTTPEKLLHWLEIVLDAYRTEKTSTLVKEAQRLMHPEVISRVIALKNFVEDEFM